MEIDSKDSWGSAQSPAVLVISDNQVGGLLRFDVVS